MTERIVDSTELVALTSETFDPAIMFKPVKVETMLALIEEKAVDFDADINTKPGQDKFRSQAFTVAKIRTAWIKEGKDQNRAINIEVKERNAQCNKIDERLSAVQAKVRQPLTDLENAIRMEEADHKRLMLRLDELKNSPSDLSADQLSALLVKTKETEIGGDILSDSYSAATVKKETAINSLQTKLANKIQYDKDQAELDELRADREKSEKERVEKLKETERAEREEQIRKDEAEKQSLENERRARAERERVEREKQEEAEKLKDAERRIEEEKASKAADIVQAQKDERTRIEKEQAEKAEAERIEREKTKKKVAAKGHRTKIHKGIVKDIIASTSITEAQANEFISMQVSGKIKKVTIDY